MYCWLISLVVSIEELCKIENSQIPEIVVTCIEFILKYGQLLRFLLSYR